MPPIYIKGRLKPWVQTALLIGSCYFSQPPSRSEHTALAVTIK